jgi:hypothetical protein
MSSDVDEMLDERFYEKFLDFGASPRASENTERTFLPRHGQAFFAINRILLRHGQALFAINRMLPRHGQALFAINRILPRHGQALSAINRILPRHGRPLLLFKIQTLQGLKYVLKLGFCSCCVLSRTWNFPRLNAAEAAASAQACTSGCQYK